MSWNISGSLTKIKDFTKEVLHEESQSNFVDQRVEELKALANHLKAQLSEKEHHVNKFNKLLAVQNYETFRQRQMNIQLIHLMHVQEERHRTGQNTEDGELFTLRNKLLKAFEVQLLTVADDVPKQLETKLQVHIQELQGRIEHLCQLNAKLIQDSKTGQVTAGLPAEGKYDKEKDNMETKILSSQEALVHSLNMLKEMEKQEMAKLAELVKSSSNQYSQLNEQLQGAEEQRKLGIHTLQELQLHLVGNDELQNQHKLEEDRYKRHINRLQQHIIEIEEMYGLEVQEAKKREHALEAKASALEKLSLKTDNQTEVEGLRFQLRKALADCEKAVKRADRAEQWANSLTTEIQNLEGVLQDFTKEAEERAKEITKLKQVLDDAERYKDIKENLVQQQKEQLKSRDLTISELRQQCEDLQDELGRVQGQVDRLQSETGKTVDKELIKNLFMGYLHTPESSKFTSMVVLAKALDFSQEEIAQYSSDHSLLDSLLGKNDPTRVAKPSAGVSIPSSKPASTTPTKSRSGPSSEMSFMEQFMTFLNRESTLLEHQPETVQGTSLLSPPSMAQGLTSTTPVAGSILMPAPAPSQHTSGAVAVGVAKLSLAQNQQQQTQSRQTNPFTSPIQSQFPSQSVLGTSSPSTRTSSFPVLATRNADVSLDFTARQVKNTAVSQPFTYGFLGPPDMGEQNKNMTSSRSPASAFINPLSSGVTTQSGQVVPVRPVQPVQSQATSNSVKFV